MGNTTSMKELEDLRQRLRQIDDEIVALVVRRMSLARDIGHLKKQHALPIMDPKRETFNSLRNLEIANGQVPEAMIQELTALLANWARQTQEKAR